MKVWWSWLTLASFAVALGGLAMMAAPALTRQAFSILVYASPDRIAGLGGPAVAYITLVHGVLGAVMFGWGIAFLSLLFGPLRRSSYGAWQAMAVSLLAWFVADTAFSLWLGVWQNALLNCGVLLVFAIPLFGMRPYCR